MAGPIPFSIFSKFLGPFGGPLGLLPSIFEFPSPATCPHIFSDISKKSHPEEIPRKKSKAQDRPKLATYYIQLLLLLLLLLFVVVVVVVILLLLLLLLLVVSVFSSSSSSSICTKLISVPNILQ